MKKPLAAVIVLTALLVGPAWAQSPDTILTNGKIVTVAPQSPTR